jgi:hypothetical protein
MSRGELLSELQQFNWAARDVPIIFDSDIAEKPRVQAAEGRLAQELGTRGAIVRQVRLPAGEDGKKVGVDDYLLMHTLEDLRALVWNTAPAKGNYEPPIPFAKLMANNYPRTEYAWADFVLAGEVNLLFGDGGMGKSLLALYIAVAVAAGQRLFCGTTMQLPVLALFAEDSEAQTQDRIAAILYHLGLDPQADQPIRLWCQPREDTLLARIDDNGTVKELPRLHALSAELAKIGRPALVVLDSFADLFALNESLRLPVNAALKRVLGGLCREFGASVLVLAHPSKASMQDGTHYSGSTAFNNAVRQRLTLELAKEERGVIEGPSPRMLRVAKSNYGPPKEKLLWVYGTSIEELPRNAVSEDQERQTALQMVLGLIDKNIRVVNRVGGQAGDARNLKDLSKSIKEQYGVSIPPKRLKDHLRRLVDSGDLTYRESNKSSRPFAKAAFVRGPACKT